MRSRKDSSSGRYCGLIVKTDDAVEETKALTITRARQLMSMPEGDSLLACRDRAILAFYLYTGARITTGCRLKVSDFH